MENSNLLTLKDLCAGYTPKNYVLSNFSINLKQHEVVGLIGLNGAGKTTFIKTLSGIHNFYTIKSAKWKGKDFSFRENEFKLKRYTVFSEEHSFKYFTFREYLSYVAKCYEKPLEDRNELIKGFNFKEYTDVIMKDLSTGNLKKVYLITAFSLKPELLLLDEPVNGLDFQSTEFLYEKIREYREFGTVLFFSHILESISLTSDRVLVLEKGRITKVFEKDEIDSSKIREVLKYDENI